jgi:hypothetical protein
MPHFTLAGILKIGFTCPVCSNAGFGTHYDSSDGAGEPGVAVGHCNGHGCKYEWLRRDDWTVFHNASTGRPFASPLEYSRLLSADEPPTFAETLYDLLGCVMERAPSVGVIDHWSTDARRAALAWASNEVMREFEPERAPSSRPVFIEEGAGTA